MRSWRLMDVFTEAVRNIAASGTRAVMFGAAAALVVGALAYVELTTTADLLAFEDGFVTAGGNVVVATTDDGLDAARCAALASQRGVVSSVAVATGPLVEVDQAPGTLFNTASVTVGALDQFVLGSSLSSADTVDRWVVGASAAQELGVGEGMWLGVDGGESRQVGVIIDTEVRNPRMQRWIMTVVPAAGTADECWVEFAPGARAGREEFVATIFADSADVVVAPWIRLDQFSRNSVAELAARPQADGWLIAGLVLAGISWLATWFRRSQIGLYRAVGTGPSTLLIFGAVEYAIPMLVGSVAGVMWAAATWSAITGRFPGADQAAIAVRMASSSFLLAAVVGPILWPALARESIAKQLKER